MKKSQTVLRLVSGYWLFSTVLEWQTMQQKQLQVNLDDSAGLSSHCWTFTWWKKSHIAHLLPAPALPSLRLHIIVLSGGCGWYDGTVQCWCCRGPLPSDISWLPHFKGNTPQTRTYNHQTNKRRHALNPFIASLKYLYGLCLWEQPLHPGSPFVHVIASQWGQHCKIPLGNV